MAQITIRGNTYPAIFDMQNMEELQAHYENGLDDVLDKLKSPQKNMKEIAYIAWLLIREGVELDNEEHRRNNPIPTQKMIEKRICFEDLVGENNISKAVEEAFFEFYGKNAESRSMVKTSQKMVMEKLSGSMTSSPGGLEMSKNG